MITLRVTEENPINIKFVEAKVKPETECNVTPEPNSQTILPTPGTTFGQVNVSPIPSEYVIPTGTKDIVTNGMHNIAGYEQVNVDVHEVPACGFTLEGWDENGCPTTLRMYGFVNPPSWYLYPFAVEAVDNSRGYFSNKLTKVIMNEGITTLGSYVFRCMKTVHEFIFPSTIETINGWSFFECNAISIFDFSNSNVIPTLVNANRITHASEWSIKVPQSLLTEWQTSSGWNSLTGVTWVGV